MSKRPKQTELTQVSPSSIASFLLCRRKWYYRFVLKQKHPQTKAQKEGERVHAFAERYLKREVRREEIPNQTIFASLKAAISDDRLPCPDGTVNMEGFGKRLVVEPWISVMIGGLPTRMKVDLAAPFIQPLPLVQDHKSVGSFDFCPEAETLRTDPQNILYGRWLQKTFDVRTYVFRHLYLHRKTPQYRITDVITTEENVNEMFALYAEVVKDMRREATRSVGQVPRTLAACSAYGGCEHYKACTQTQTNGRIEMARARKSTQTNTSGGKAFSGKTAARRGRIKEESEKADAKASTRSSRRGRPRKQRPQDHPNVVRMRAVVDAFLALDEDTQEDLELTEDMEEIIDDVLDAGVDDVFADKEFLQGLVKASTEDVDETLGDLENALEIDGNEDDDDETPPPTKRRGRTRTKKAPEPDEESEEDEAPAPKKRRGRPRKNTTGNGSAVTPPDAAPNQTAADDASDLLAHLGVPNRYVKAFERANIETGQQLVAHVESGESVKDVKGVAATAFDDILRAVITSVRARSGCVGGPSPQSVSTQQSGGFVLLVDCAMAPNCAIASYEQTHADVLFAELYKSVASEFEDIDGNENPTDYFAYPGYVAGEKAFAAALQDNIEMLDGKVLVVDSSSPGAAHAIQVLRPLAMFVVEGRSR